MLCMHLLKKLLLWRDNLCLKALILNLFEQKKQKKKPILYKSFSQLSLPLSWTQQSTIEAFVNEIFVLKMIIRPRTDVHYVLYVCIAVYMYMYMYV